jgi:2-hydroxychromene-2-carboxylate isomerase
MQPGLSFWFEFASTYSYLAACRIEDVARTADVAVAWRPFLLGPIFKAQGWNDSPFNIYPAKGRYMWRDMERLCARYRIPFRRPSRFPRNGLLAARVVVAGEEAGWIPAFVRAVYRANFADDADVGERAVLDGLLREVGADARAVLDAAESDAVKERLRRNTEEAGRLGIFGAPSFIAREELFWGNDRLEDALAWARGASPEPH